MQTPPDLFSTVQPENTPRSCAYPRELVLPDGHRHAVTYRVLPLDAVLASHRIDGEKNMPHTNGYPRRVQFREYAGARGESARRAVWAAAKALDNDQLLDLTCTAAAGPPVVAREAQRDLCVIGNQRVLALQAARACYPDQYAAYARALCDRAPLFGLHLDDVDRAGAWPILVRRLSPELFVGLADNAFYKVLGHINRASDAPITKARDAVTTAMTLAAEVRAIHHDPLGHEQTDSVGTAAESVEHSKLRRQSPLQRLVETLDGRSPGRYFASADGYAFLNLLVAHRVVGLQEVAAYVTPGDERLSATGRAALVAMTCALAFDDPDVFDVAPRYALAGAKRGMGALLMTATAQAWDLTRDLGAALRLLGQLERSNTRVLDFVDAYELGMAPADGTAAAVDRATRRPDGHGRDTSAVSPRAMILAGFVEHVGRRSSGRIADALEAWADAADAAGALRGGQLALPELLGDPRRARREHRQIQAPRGAGPQEAFVTLFARSQRLRDLWDRVRPLDAAEQESTVGETHPALPTLLNQRLKHYGHRWPAILAQAAAARHHPKPKPARSGRPREINDATVYATIRIAIEKGVSITELGGGWFADEKTCRRRLQQWRKDLSLIRAIRATLPSGCRLPGRDDVAPTRAARRPAPTETPHAN